MIFNERIDTVDLIVNVLKEHEKSLDTLVSQLGVIVSQLAISDSPNSNNNYRIILRRWFEFRNQCFEPEIVTFRLIGDKFYISSIKDGILYTYSETIPDVNNDIEKDEIMDIENDDFISNKCPSELFIRTFQYSLQMNTNKIRNFQPKRNISPKLIYNVDQDKVKAWLSDQLKIDKKMIIYGELNNEQKINL
jgi:hypothetical protein